MSNVRINRKSLLVELGSSEPLLKREAEAVIRQQLFEPAVAALQEAFQEHPVTEEIRGGVNAPNDSGTLEAPFNDPPQRKDGREVTDYSPPNLFSFIGFEAGSDPLAAIEERLEEGHRDGPKLKYVNMDKDRLAFRFRVSAPDSSAIEAATPVPWAPGISWARRIEQGIAGIGHYLNALNRKGSRSGGGIQVEPNLRTGRFRPVKYLSSLFNDFLRRASSGREPL